MFIGVNYRGPTRRTRAH